MDLCLYTDSVADLSFEAALDLAARIGCASIEIAGGGQSSAPHLKLDELLGDRRKRVAFADAFARRGLRIAALNCSAWPLHPVKGPAQAAIIRNTIRLAGELGVETLVSMSGTPGDGPGASTIDWVFYPWPADAVALQARQWEATLSFWHDMAAQAAANGVRQIAFELHPLHLVFNVPTLFRMREAIGPVIGANMDPSHLFWQQMDPLAAIAALGPAIQHVHLKDLGLQADRLALAGVLDTTLFEDARDRAWVFRTIGRVHDRAWWASFIAALKAVGYDGPLSIEHEDPYQSPVEGVEEAAAFIGPLIG
ncbi:MAG TPA: sugar phosphate isomerase/epimerase [Candidatus Dormibacteraeota bacterium]|nr:sugar phosphate isomerase/epimerase [Candidatus Dormibacteraeota bacterium]